MRLFVPLLAAAAVLGGCAAMPPSSCSPAADLRIDPARLNRHVSVLASDEFEGRGPTTPGEEKTVAYIAEQLRAAGVRVGYDAASNEDYRVRIKTASLMKVPYMAVIGAREAAAGTVTVRVRGAEKAQVTMPVAEFVAKVAEEIRSHAVTLGIVPAGH